MEKAVACEPTAYSSLRMRWEVVLADPKPKLARLIRGGLALACIPPARATISANHRRTLCTVDGDAVAWSKRLHASQRRTARYVCYRGWYRHKGLLADPEPVLARLIRGCIAVACTASASIQQPSS